MPTFPPLPGQAQVTMEQLVAVGTYELFAVYAGIASGWVVVGAPGAGKTSSQGSRHSIIVNDR
jgi:hypothetical protein